MKKEYEEYLFKKYKWYHPEYIVQQSLMAFGFMCDDGWFELIKKLSENINKEVKKESQKFRPKPKDLYIIYVKYT